MTSYHNKKNSLCNQKSVFATLVNWMRPKNLKVRAGPRSFTSDTFCFDQKRKHLLADTLILRKSKSNWHVSETFGQSNVGIIEFWYSLRPISTTAVSFNFYPIKYEKQIFPSLTPWLRERATFGPLVLPLLKTVKNDFLT